MAGSGYSRKTKCFFPWLLCLLSHRSLKKAGDRRLRWDGRPVLTEVKAAHPPAVPLTSRLQNRVGLSSRALLQTTKLHGDGLMFAAPVSRGSQWWQKSQVVTKWSGKCPGRKIWTIQSLIPDLTSYRSELNVEWHKIAWILLVLGSIHK